MIRTFTAMYVRHGDWWIGTVEEVPGAISQERTLEETRESLVEAVQLILDVNREYAAQEVGDAPVVREPLFVAA
jgi:predicted RNase H-like HicB family nuclease